VRSDPVLVRESRQRVASAARTRLRQAPARGSAAAELPGGWPGGPRRGSWRPHSRFVSLMGVFVNKIAALD
jgi:hypothetical protein